jgi:hypothetical protein
MMTAIAPYPHELADIVEKLKYKKGFRFELGPHTDDGGAEFLAFQIIAVTDDSIAEGQRRGTRHLFIVPASTYNRANWLRWCYERVIDVERHEAAEFFSIAIPFNGRDYDHDKVLCPECEHPATNHDGRDNSCSGCNSAYHPEDRHPHRFELKPEDVKYRRLFPPLHGNGNDPYFQWHVTTPEEVLKSPGED